MFRSIWVQMGSFRKCMKVGAKHTELVQLLQMFVPRNRVVIFRNECTPSTPLDPKLMFRAFRSILVYLGSFRKCMKVGAKQTELVQLIQKFVP